MAVSEEMIKEEEQKQNTKRTCEWIKTKKVECRFPELMSLTFVSGQYHHSICLCCLLGWYLEKCL